MGSITSLVDGSTHHYSELVTVTYDSGTFDFGNGAGQIATLVFEQNGIPKATRSTQPTAAPATYSQSWALPASGATAIIRVHAKNLMGMVLETVEVTLNLDAQPAATCAGATDQAMDALTLNGNIVGIPAGGSAQFRYGTVNGGPYPDTIPAFPQAVGPTSAALTGLTAGTVYYYVLEILDASSTVVATSPQCSGQTLLDANQAGPACPVPPFVDECPPKQVYSVGGVEYISYQFCDKATNTPILAVYQLCDGEPSGAPTYYDLLGQPYIPVGTVGLCDTGIDYETLCDKGTDPNTRILALWDTSTVPPTLDYFTPAADGTLTPYVPVGPVGACPETDTEESQLCHIAMTAGDGYAVGDQLLQILFWDTGENPPTLTATVWRNQTQNTTLATAPLQADLTSCGTSTVTAEIGCITTVVNPAPFAPAFPGAAAQWQRSIDFGVTWASNPAPSIAHTTDVTDKERYRTTVTIPADVVGTLRVGFSGDNYDGIPNDPGSMYWDGILVSGDTGLGVLTYVEVPAVPGPHTLEWRHGVLSDGVTALEVSYDYTEIRLPDTHTPVEIIKRFDAQGNLLETTVLSADGVTTYDLPLPAGQTLTTGPCPADSLQMQMLCDDSGTFIRRYRTRSDGEETFADFALDGVTAYVATGLVGVCPEVSESPTSECFVADTDGDGYAAGDRLIQVLFWDVSTTPNAVSETAWYNVSAGTTLGTIPLPADLRPCGLAVTPESFCYSAITTEAEWTTGDTLRYIRFYDSSNRNDIALSGELWWNVTAGTPISASPVIGTDAVECPTECNQHEFVILCDDDGAGTITKFLRHLTITCGGTVYIADTEFDGNTPYDVVGTVTTCGSTGKDLIKACDKVTTAGGPVAGTCGVNQQTIDAVDIQDAEEKNPTTGGSAVNVNDNDLELAGESEVGETDWQIAVRFNMNIPQGATICNAYIQFTSEGTVSTGALTATIRGENVDASAPFTTAAGMLTARVKTAASVAWTVPQWPSSNQAGADQRTPDLTTIVQEIVNRAGWTANNAAAFFLIPGTTGYRRASSILDGTEAPKLHVEYVVDQATSETTVCIPFWKEVDLSSGTATGNNYRINETTGDWEAYTPTGTVTDGECVCPGDIATDFELIVLCDDNGSFIRHIVHGAQSGTVSQVFDTALDGTTAYTVTGTVKRCDIKGATPIILCDDNGSFLRHLVYANDGLSATIYDTAFDGTTAYTAVGTVKRCDFAIAYQLLCDYSAGTVVPFLRRFAQAETGALVVTDTALDAVTAYTVAGTVGDCALANVDPVILCDDNGSFLRHVLYSGDGTTVTVFDTDMDGVDYTTVGTVKNCGASGRALIQACDKTTETTGNVPGACGTNQQTVDAVDIQDAEEKDVASGLEVNVNDNDLEMAGTAEAGESDHQIGVRFALNVPKGAKICSAYIQFTSRSTTSFGTLIATIRGEAADTSAPFTTTAGMLTARAKTTANVSWNVPLWPTSGQAGAAQRTPDLSTIVQEIVDRAGWVAGNNTAFIFTPGATGYRRAQSLPRGTAVAPKLHVEYVLDTPGGSTDVCVPFYKEIDLSTGLATGNNYRLNAGTWSAYTPTGTVTDGNCLSCTVQRSSTIQRQVGAGTVTVASGARSLSIVVLSGQPTVSIGAGAAVALATGISLNWGASSDKEVLTDAFSFTCAAGDDLIVTTIR